MPLSAKAADDSKSPDSDDENQEWIVSDECSGTDTECELHSDTEPDEENTSDDKATQETLITLSGGAFDPKQWTIEVPGVPQESMIPLPVESTKFRTYAHKETGVMLRAVVVQEKAGLLVVHIRDTADAGLAELKAMSANFKPKANEARASLPNPSHATAPKLRAKSLSKKYGAAAAIYNEAYALHFLASCAAAAKVKRQKTLPKPVLANTTKDTKSEHTSVASGSTSTSGEQTRDLHPLATAKTNDACMNSGTGVGNIPSSSCKKGAVKKRSNDPLLSDSTRRSKRACTGEAGDAEQSIVRIVFEIPVHQIDTSRRFALAFLNARDI